MTNEISRGSERTSSYQWQRPTWHLWALFYLLVHIFYLSLSSGYRILLEVSSWQTLGPEVPVHQRRDLQRVLKQPGGERACPKSTSSPRVVTWLMLSSLGFPECHLQQPHTKHCPVLAAPLGSTYSYLFWRGDLSSKETFKEKSFSLAFVYLLMSPVPDQLTGCG